MIKHNIPQPTGWYYHARKTLTISAAEIALVVCAVSFSTTTVHAQNSAQSILLEEIVVTARKRQETAFDAPLAVSAFSSEQLDVLKVRDIQSLSVGMPNVAFDDIGTTRGTANFSIRGLGINSSIPSIDPTVGTFVDGVYLGINQGTIFDVFDLESIEVLRGPQGTLFGRNVTGGAVLLNTKLPGEEFEGKARVAFEGGGEEINTYLMGSIGGPVSDTFGMRLSAYNNQDDGYFLNQFNGEAHGKQDVVSIRPSFVWAPTDNLQFALRYEYYDAESDGPSAQNHVNGLGVSNAAANFDRDSLDISIDEEGFLDTQSDFINLRMDWDLENGTVTGIFGQREVDQAGTSDIDATPLDIFNASIALDQEQTSFELRYTGDIGEKLNLTTGIFTFESEMLYAEQRRLLGLVAPPGFYGLTQDGGGDYRVDTTGLYLSLDYQMSDRLVLNVGANYTDEEKEVQIASLILNTDSICNVLEGTCQYDFSDSESWSNLAPKLGFTYDYSDATMVYGHITRGYRSGGYNLRNSAIDTVNFGPGPFDEEQVDSIELGFKKQFDNGGRLTGAIFSTSIEDMQREINLPDPVAGVVQVIRNTADTDILGVELDGLFPISDRVLLNASIGYIDPEYDSVRFDLNGDGVINDADTKLDLPRAANLTYSIGLTLESAIGNWGSATSRINYAFRDESAYTDNNLGFINEQRILDAGIDFHSNDSQWQFGIFAKNLLDEVKQGGDTILPTLLGPLPLGGTFSPLGKGRIIGVDATLNF